MTLSPARRNFLMSKIGCACQSCDSPTNWLFTKIPALVVAAAEANLHAGAFQVFLRQREMRAVNRRGVRRFDRQFAAAGLFSSFQAESSKSFAYSGRTRLFLGIFASCQRQSLTAILRAARPERTRPARGSWDRHCPRR